MALHRLTPLLRSLPPGLRSSENALFPNTIMGGISYHGFQSRRWTSLLVGPNPSHSFRRFMLSPPSQLGYGSTSSSTITRNLFTDSLRTRWDSVKLQFRHTMIETPKLALRNAVRDVPISHTSRSALSNAVSKPLQAAKSTALHYKEAVGLQFDAFWRRNYLLLLGAFGFGVCLLLWRAMFGIASMFVGLSERVANMGFLALAAAMVILTGLILRARYTINPDKVYRITMRTLNTSAAALEVLGPPLTGTDVRAYIMSGGGLRLKNFRPKFGNKRCFLIFPVRGSERNGLVNVEVKKRKGKYDLKLLAVDYTEGGREQKLFLIGDEIEYKVGGGLISELRDPIVKAMTSQKEFDEQDEKEEEDEERANKARQKHVLEGLESDTTK